MMYVYVECSLYIYRVCLPMIESLLFNKETTFQNFIFFFQVKEDYQFESTDSSSSSVAFRDDAQGLAYKAYRDYQQQ